MTIVMGIVFERRAMEETMAGKRGENELPAQQEMFAQFYIQTGNASEAYRRPYPKSQKWKPEAVYAAASGMLANKVSVRVEALQAEAAERHGVTLDYITRQLESDREAARTARQWSAAIRASEVIAKLHGLSVDRRELTGKSGGPIQTESNTDAFMAELAKIRKRIEETEIGEE